MDEDFELIKVDAAEIRELLAQVSPEVREAAMFATGLANAPPIVVRVRNPSKGIH
jgi:hypothetical protein